jgi:hypothetical protein
MPSIWRQQRATGTRLSRSLQVGAHGDLVTALDGLLNSAHSPEPDRDACLVLLTHGPPPRTRRCAPRRRHDDAQFRLRGWCQACLALSGPSIALFEPDGVEFAAALIGAWYAGKTVYVPGDVQPDTCRALAHVGVHFAGAFPDPWSTIGTVHDGDASLPFDVLDANTAALVIYTSGSTGVPQALHKRAGQLLAEVGTLEQLFGARVEEVKSGDGVTPAHLGLLSDSLAAGHWAHLRIGECAVSNMWWRICASSHTVISGPAHLKRLPQSPSGRPRADWPRCSLQAARFRSIPSHRWNRAQQAPIEVWQLETGGIAGANAPADTKWTPFPVTGS